MCVWEGGEKSCLSPMDQDEDHDDDDHNSHPVQGLESHVYLSLLPIIYEKSFLIPDTPTQGEWKRDKGPKEEWRVIQWKGKRRGKREGS